MFHINCMQYRLYIAYMYSSTPPKMSSFTQPQVVSNLHEFLSSVEHKKRK